MSTGYTAGILDGTITTFPEFAKTCMRAFGATVHMRDDGMYAEYRPMIISIFYEKEIEDAKQRLKDAEVLSDEVLLNKERKRLEKGRAHYLKSIEEAKTNTKLLTRMLKNVRKWQPPTPDHTGLKSFMIDQIERTIDFDYKDTHYEKTLAKIELDLRSLNVEKIRKDMMKRAKDDLQYYTEKQNEDVRRCEKSNRWVVDLLESLKPFVEGKKKI